MTINNLLVGSSSSTSNERDPHDLYYFKRKYKLGPEIGRGGFGVVYAGYRIEDRLSVAVKYVARRNVTEWSSLEGRNVPLEIALLDTCKDLPGCIRTIDWYERQDGYFIVMERPTPFCDLFDFISDRGALEEILARSLFKQIVETAVACKNLNVIHRDIKDENIILDITNGQIKLIDFGSGAFMRPGGEYTDFEGTRVYGPPEWILHSRYDGLKATTWSLGVLLFDMVAGDIPFHQDHEICSGVINWKPSISPDCRDLIQRCLMLDPKRRASLGDILRHRWMQGPVRKLGPAELSMRKRPLDGIRATNPEEQDIEIMQMASMNNASPPNADELYHLEQEKSRLHQHAHVHPHHKPSPQTGNKCEEKVVERRHVPETSVTPPPEDEEDALAGCSSTTDESSDHSTRHTADDDDESEAESEEAGEEQETRENRRHDSNTEEDALPANNNPAEMPLWWRMAVSAGVTDDSRNNNHHLISHPERKTPGGLNYQSSRGGSDQNLPSAVLYEGAPTIQLEHPSTSSFYHHHESTKSRPPSNSLHKNPSWNEPKKPATTGCFVSITQPIYRQTSNTAVFPATFAAFKGADTKTNLASLAMGRRPQHHRSTGGPRQFRQSNAPNSTLPRGTKSSSIGRQETAAGMSASSSGPKKQMDRKTAVDSGFSSGSNGYVFSGSPPGGSFMLGSY